MRMLVLIPLVLVAACGVDNDTRNDSVTVKYDSQELSNTVGELGNAAEEAADQIGNAAVRAGDNIRNEVGDIDIDVDINRNRNSDGNSN